MPASQDYRDGASTATHVLRKRLIDGLDWGFPLTRATIQKVSEEVCALYGGHVSEPVPEVAIAVLSNDEIETALRRVPLPNSLNMDDYDELARSVGLAIDAKVKQALASSRRDE